MRGEWKQKKIKIKRDRKCGGKEAKMVKNGREEKVRVNYEEREEEKGREGRKKRASVEEN